MTNEDNLPAVKETLTNLFALTPHPDKLDFINHFALKINELITQDFDQLIRILYRLDISEQKLRDTLKKYEHDDAGYIIAQLIIERELQKMDSRKKYKRNENIPDDDAW